jgi:hypothetical protein
VFHLHSTGFEPRSFFWGPGMGYTSEPSPLESKFDRWLFPPGIIFLEKTIEREEGGGE